MKENVGMQQNNVILLHHQADQVIMFMYFYCDRIFYAGLNRYLKWDIFLDCCTGTFTAVKDLRTSATVCICLQEGPGALSEDVTRRAAAFVINVREQCHLSQVLTMHPSHQYYVYIFNLYVNTS